MSSYTARRTITRCRACRNGRNRARTYSHGWPGPFSSPPLSSFFGPCCAVVPIPRPIHILVTLDWAKNSYARHVVTLATTMVRWPIVLRSDALQPVSTGIAHGGGRSSQPPPSDATNMARSVILSRFSLRVTSSLCFPKVIPILTPPKTRAEEFLLFKAGFASIAAAAEKRLGPRVPIVPSGFRYTKNNRWTTGLNIGEGVYLEDFASRQLLLSYIEQRVAEVSGLSTAGQS
jgi:hypothetical protein